MKLPITFFYGLLFLSVLMTTIGGLIDMGYISAPISKKHAWNDGLYLAVFTIALFIITKHPS